MYPRQHAVVSGATVGIAGVISGLPFQELLVWISLGAVAGVFIDLDHLPIAVVFSGKTEEVLYWLRRPLDALMNGRELKEDIDPGDVLIVHRLLSHLLIFLVSVALYLENPFFLPVAVGIGAHILADIYWDFRTQEGFPYI